MKFHHILNSRLLFPGRCWQQTGFTLAELMIGVAIVSILAGTSTIISLNTLPKYRLNKAVRILMGQMQQTRLNAIKTNRPWRIWFGEETPGLYNYVIWDSGLDRTFGCPLTSATISPLVAGAGAPGDDVFMEPVNLADYGSGVTYGAGTALTLWDGTNISTVILGPPVLPGPPLITTFTDTVPKATGFIQFSEKGLCNPGAIFLTNNENSMAFAISATIAGGIKLRKFNGMTPYNALSWLN